jgi:protein farnesyltransferase subunit beta
MQAATEDECAPYLIDLSSLPEITRADLQEIGLLNEASDPNHSVCLLKSAHASYLSQVWTESSDLSSSGLPLPWSFVGLDASRAWMIYWCLHGCDLCGVRPSVSESINIVTTLDSFFTRCLVKIPRARVENDEVLQRVMAEESNACESSQSTSDDAQSSYVEVMGGGFGGGPGQIPHAATTYAAVLALVILATSDASSGSDSSNVGNDATNYNELANDDYELVRAAALQVLQGARLPLYVWMNSLLQDASQSTDYINTEGGFRMHDDGEIDVRATYCLVSVARLLRIDLTLWQHPSIPAFVARCQTHEGGFGGLPFAEAHGGYTFCAVAALALLGKLHTVRTDDLLHWLVHRQMSFEGGFQGRTHKLVDGCYSFWQGSAATIVSQFVHHVEKNTESDTTAADTDPWITSNEETKSVSIQTTSGEEAGEDIKVDASTTAAPILPPPLPLPLLFDDGMLERYILLCAQNVHGGLRDKPSKRRDYYHTCYNLSGLSVAQHCGGLSDTEHAASFGHSSSIVATTHPCYNIQRDRVKKITSHFAEAGPPSLEFKIQQSAEPTA